MNKHTKGPWVTHNDIDGTELIISEDETRTIAHVFTYEQWPNAGRCGCGVRRQAGSKPAGWDEGMANSALIAKAPEMFAELSKLREENQRLRDQRDVAIADYRIALNELESIIAWVDGPYNTSIARMILKGAKQ